MAKLNKALKELTYSSIASKVLVELYGKGPMRSSTLVPLIKKELNCSSGLVYSTLRELKEGNWIYTPTARKRFKVYAITNRGIELVEEEFMRRETEIKEISKKIADPSEMALELLTNEIFADLPSDTRKPMNRMLIKRRLQRNIEKWKQSIKRSVVET